jgi:Flp pilus assembly protein TadD
MPGKDREPEPKKEAKKAPVKPAPGKAGPRLPRPPAPADDPREEAERLEELGRESFMDLEYGRAAQRFQQAVRLAPTRPMPRFLLAQALVAQGKYHEAHEAILEGLKLKPDWPTEKFRPVELYGPAVGEYPEHLAALEEARRRHPDDPVLLFLLAYQLWFDGRKEEARPLLRRALPRAKDRTAIERFLRALPPEDL